MRIVAALGGNALLRRGEAMTMENQRRNVRTAAEALMPLALEHELVITHGNGPQVGLLALQSALSNNSESLPLDVLDAESEGMIGYLIEQELNNLLPQRRCATLLTQIEVSAQDPAFQRPTKPIGPLYSPQQAHTIAEQRGWSVAPDGEYYRRVVPSPRPLKILELDVIDWLVEQGVLVICAGGGGIPVVRRKDGGLIGVEAVIDKDMASALLAEELKADLLLLLTDVDGVHEAWGSEKPRLIRNATRSTLGKLRFDEGSMGPKVAAACRFVARNGRRAAIGPLHDIAGILNGSNGTLISDRQSQL